MPDANGFPLPHEIASGAAGEAIEQARKQQDAVLAGVLHQLTGKPPTQDLVKAFRILVNCPTVIVVGMIETQRKGVDVKTGCDFHTSMAGNEDTLRNVKGEIIEGVIERAYQRHGIF